MLLRSLVLTALCVALAAWLGCQADGSGPGDRFVPSQPNRLASGVRAAPSDGGAREDPEVADAVALHLKGVDGDDVAATAALGRLVELRKRYPDDPRITAYLGSARILAARRMVLPWEQGRTCKLGLELLNKVVSENPEMAELRFLRAVSTYPLPAFLGQREQCASDLRWLVDRRKQAVGRGELTRPMASLVLLYHGDVRLERGDVEAAREAWETAARLSPGEPPGRLAGQRLQDLDDTAGAEE